MACLFALGGLLPNLGVAFAKPETVRIASIAANRDGKSVISGGQSAVLAAQGWLEAELQKIGVKLEWLPVPAAVGGTLVQRGTCQ